MSRLRYVATTDSGGVVRRSSSRVYTHAVCWRYVGGEMWHATWCGSHELALRKYRQMLSTSTVGYERVSVQIVEAVAV